MSTRRRRPPRKSATEPDNLAPTRGATGGLHGRPLLDLEHETVLPLSRAHRHPLLRQGRRDGRPVARQTLERWRCRGVRAAGGQRVTLETMLIGGTRVTSAEAITRFFARLNGGGSGPALPSPAAARREHARAEAELERLGI